MRRGARRRQALSAWIERGRWIPWSFAAMLGLVVMANGTMVFLAFESWPGLVSRSAYQEGLRYNERLAAREAQAAQGWRLAMQATTEDKRLLLAVDLEDRDGRPLLADRVEALISRPSGEGLEFLALLAPAGPGRFATELELPLAGVWDIAVTARRGEASHRASERLFLQP